MKIGTGVSEGQKELDDDKLRWLFFFCESMQRAQDSTKQFSTLREQSKWRLQEITASQQPALKLRCSLAAVMFL